MKHLQRKIDNNEITIYRTKNSTIFVTFCLFCVYTIFTIGHDLKLLLTKDVWGDTFFRRQCTCSLITADTVKPKFFVCPLFCNLSDAVKLKGRKYSISCAILVYYLVQQAKTWKLQAPKLGMYRISGSGWPDIRPFFSNPVPAKTVPSTGYLSRIVLGPFRQLVELSSPSEWAPYCQQVHLNFKELVSHVDQLFYIYQL